MNRVGRRLASGILAGMLVTAMTVGGEAHASSPIVLPRPGQVGVGAQGGVGTFLRTGDLGDEFSSGATIAIRLRYRMRYERAFGLSFESQNFDIRAAEAEFPAGSGLPGRTSLSTVLSGLEFYQMFGTRTRSTKMLMVGAGLAQFSEKTRDGDTVFPGDGAYVSAGAGVEYFFMRSWAFDLSGRYMGVFHDGQKNHELQIGLGMMFYASY